MALYSKKDFAAICGISTRQLSVYIGREKLLMSGDYIDDSIQANQLFIAKRQLSAEIENSENGDVRTKKLNTSSPDSSPIEDDGNLYSLTKKRISTDIEKKKLEMEILTAKIEKVHGEVMPVDLVKNIFLIHTKSIVIAQKDGIELLLVNLAAEARLTNDQISKLRGKMIAILNEGVDKAIAASKKNINLIVTEFSNKKGIGEHD